MFRYIRNNENGSYLVLMVFMIFAFLMFGVLSMDYAGKIYQEHKKQNAVDAAVMNAANYFPDIDKVREGLLDYVTQVNDEAYQSHESYQYDTAGLMTFMLEADAQGDTLARWEDESCSNIVYYESPYFIIAYDSVTEVGTVALTLPSLYDPMLLPRSLFGDKGWLYYNKAIAVARREKLPVEQMPPEFTNVIFAGDLRQGTVSIVGVQASVDTRFISPFVVSSDSFSTLSNCDTYEATAGPGEGTTGNFGYFKIGEPPTTGASELADILHFDYVDNKTVSVGDILSSQTGVDANFKKAIEWRINGNDNPPGAIDADWDNIYGGVDVPGGVDPDDDAGMETWNEDCTNYNTLTPRFAILPVATYHNDLPGNNYEVRVTGFAAFLIKEYVWENPDKKIRLWYLGPYTPPYVTDININGNVQVNNQFGDFEMTVFEKLNISGNVNITSAADVSIDTYNQYEDPNVSGTPVPDATLLNNHTTGTVDLSAAAEEFPLINPPADGNLCIPGIQNGNYNSPIIAWIGNTNINNPMTFNGTIYCNGKITIDIGVKIEGNITFVADDDIVFDHNTGAGKIGTSLSDLPSSNLFFYAGADGTGDIIFSAYTGDTTYPQQDVNVQGFMYAPHGNIGNEYALPGADKSSLGVPPKNITIDGSLYAGEGIYLQARDSINVNYKNNQALPRADKSKNFRVHLVE